MQLRRREATYPFPAILNRESINDFFLCGEKDYCDGAHVYTG